MWRSRCPDISVPVSSHRHCPIMNYSWAQKGGGRVWWSQCPDIPVPVFSHRHRPIMNYCWAQRGGGQPCMAESMSRHSCPCFQSPPSTFMNYWAGLGTVERAGVNVQTNLPVLSNRHRPTCIINYCWAHWHSNMHSKK